MTKLGFPAPIAAALLLAPLWVFAADVPSAPHDEIVKPLFDMAQVGLPDKELLMLTVEYLPGGASLPHRHDAQVFVYVLEGDMKMQIAGSPAVTLHKGQTFYEGPNDVHAVSANASKTSPAKILVFIVKDKSTPVSRAASAAATP
jgi:quercetin dioxygenase-like cupin family protein